MKIPHVRTLATKQIIQKKSSIPGYVKTVFMQIIATLCTKFGQNPFEDDLSWVYVEAFQKKVQYHYNILSNLFLAKE